MQATFFTAANIFALLDSIEGTDGSYKAVSAHAESRHGIVIAHLTVARWVVEGRRDQRSGSRSTAYARFAARWDSLVKEHCGAEASRSRQLNLAFEMLDTGCECGGQRTRWDDGSLDMMCQDCRGLDEQKLA